MQAPSNQCLSATPAFIYPLQWLRAIVANDSFCWSWPSTRDIKISIIRWMGTVCHDEFVILRQESSEPREWGDRTKQSNDNAAAYDPFQNSLLQLKVHD